MAGYLKLDDAQDEITRRLTDFGQSMLTQLQPERTVQQVAQPIQQGVTEIQDRLNQYGQGLLNTGGEIGQRINTFGQQALQQAQQANQPPLAGTRVGGDLHAYARQAAQRAGIDPDIFERQIQQESGFRTDARSPAGATGIAQIVPQYHPNVDPNDPYASLDYAAGLMRSNLGKYQGDYAKSLAAYNAGGGNVDQYGGVPPFEETQRYVSTILGGGPAPSGPSISGPVPPSTGAPTGALPAISQFGDKQLSSAEAYAACGPAAAARFAQLFGRNPTLREATDLAAGVGWNQERGMAGLSSESKLFDALGIPHRIVGPDWSALAREASSGNPVTISTSGHYFTADSYNPQTGAFHVGSSGTDLRGGSEWMTAEQMESRMGTLQGGLVADHPTVPAPSPLSRGVGAVMGAASSVTGALTGAAQNLDQTIKSIGSGITGGPQQINQPVSPVPAPGGGYDPSALRPAEPPTPVTPTRPVGAPLPSTGEPGILPSLKEAGEALTRGDLTGAGEAMSRVGQAATTAPALQPLKPLRGPALIGDQEYLDQAGPETVRQMRSDRQMQGLDSSDAAIAGDLRGQDFAMRVVAAQGGAEVRPSMGGGTVGISQTPTFLREALRRMYPGAINRAAAKEAVQNSVDASRGMFGANTVVNIDNPSKTISIVDQGKGMSPQTMESVFVKLGGSEKPAGASGGMGTAIKAVMANAEDTWVRTVGRDGDGRMTDSVMHGSSDDFLGGTMHRYYADQGAMPESELSGAPPVIRDLPTDSTGTAIWVKPLEDAPWSTYSLMDYVNKFNQTSRIKDQNVQFHVDGVRVEPGKQYHQWDANQPPSAYDVNPDELPSELIDTIHTPGAQIDLYGSKATGESGNANVHLLNNGQYQADLSVYLDGNARLPLKLSANIRPLIGPKEPGYPWTADRNALIDVDANALKGYVKDKLASAAIAKENVRVKQVIDSAPVIKRSGGMRLVDDAEVGQRPSGQAVLAKVQTSANYGRLARTLNDLHDSLSAELVGRQVGAGQVGESHMIGLGASDKWLGLNVPPDYAPWAAAEPNTRGILMNPWAIWHEVEQAWGGAPRAEQLERFNEYTLGTMLHEISHNTSVRGHEESFAGILTRIPAFLGTSMRQAITKQLQRQLGPIWETLVDDLSDDAQSLRNAAGESTLGRYGTELGAQPGRGGPDVLAGAAPGGPAGGPPAGGPANRPGGGPVGGAPGAAQVGYAAGLGGLAAAAGVGAAALGGDIGDRARQALDYLSPEAVERRRLQPYSPEFRARAQEIAQAPVQADTLGGLLETGGQPFRPQSFEGDIRQADRQADALIAKARENGWNPTPQEEATIRRAAVLASPGSVGGALLTGGLTGVAELGLAGAGQVGAEVAARRAGVPEEAVPIAGLAGGIAAPIGALRVARSPAAREFLAGEEGGGPWIFGLGNRPKRAPTADEVSGLAARGEQVSQADRALYQQTQDALAKGKPPPPGAKVSNVDVTLYSGKKEFKNQVVQMPVFETEDGLQIPLKVRAEKGAKGGYANMARAAYTQSAKELGGNLGFPFGRWRAANGDLHTFDSAQEVAFMADLDQQKATGQIDDWWKWEEAPDEANVRNLEYVNNQPDKFGVDQYEPDIVVRLPNGGYEVREVKGAKVLAESEDVGPKDQLLSGGLGWHVLKKASGTIPELASRGVGYRIMGEDEAARIVDRMGVGGSRGARLASLPGVDWRDMPELASRGIGGAPAPGAETAIGKGLQIMGRINAVAEQALARAQAGQSIEQVTRFVRDELLPTAEIAGREHGEMRLIDAQLLAHMPVESAPGTLTLDQLSARWPEAGAILERATTRGVQIGPVAMQHIAGPAGGPGLPRMLVQLSGDPAGIRAAAAEIGQLSRAEAPATLIFADDLGTSGLRRLDVRLPDASLEARLMEIAQGVEASSEGHIRVIPSYNDDGSLGYLHLASDTLEGQALTETAHALERVLASKGITATHAAGHGRAQITNYAEGAESATEIARQQRILGEVGGRAGFEPELGRPPPWSRTVAERTVVGPEGRLVAAGPGAAGGESAGAAIDDFLSSEAGAASVAGGLRLGAAGVGGLVGAATAPEGASPEERLLRAGAGAAAGYVGARPWWRSQIDQAVLQSLRAGQLQTGPGRPQPAGVIGVASDLSKQGLLTDPVTHLGNMVGNTIELFRQPIRLAAGGKWDEATAASVALMRATPEAFGNMASVLLKGQQGATLGTEAQRIGKAQPVYRALGAMDIFTRTLGEYQGMAAKSLALLREAGIEPGSAAASSYLASHANEIAEAGARGGMTSVFGAEKIKRGGLGMLDEMMSKATQYKEALLASPDRKRQLLGAALDTQIPFMGVPTRLLQIAVNRLPVISQMSAAARAVAAHSRGDTLGMHAALGDALLETAIQIKIAQAISDGAITGPDDLEHPSSINLGGNWIPLRQLGGYTLPMQMMAAYAEGSQKATNEPGASQGDLIGAGLASAGKTFWRAVPGHNLVDLLSSVGQGQLPQAATKLGTDLATRYTSTAALRQVENLTDPVMRDVAQEGPEHILDSIKQRWPILAQSLPPKIDPATGQVMPRPRSGISQILSQEEGVQPNALRQEIQTLRRQGYTGLNQPRDYPDHVTIQGSEIPLSPDEQRKVTQITGRMLGDLTNRLNEPEYKARTPEEKARYVRVLLDAASRARVSAVAEVIGQDQLRERWLKGRKVEGRLTDEARAAAGETESVTPERLVNRAGQLIGAGR